MGWAGPATQLVVESLISTPRERRRSAVDPSQDAGASL